MYNPELKAQFIEDYSNSLGVRRVIAGTFRRIEKYEDEWGADICTRSKEELQPVVDELTGARADSQSPIVYLRAYSKWCVEHGVEGANDEIRHVNEPGLSKVKKQMFANPQHLQRFLDCVFEKEDKETGDCVYRAYFWLIYSGIDSASLFKIRTTDVDFMDAVVRVGNREFPIYREAIPALKQCVNLTVFKVYHPNCTVCTYRDRVPGTLLLRLTGDNDGMEINDQHFRCKLSQKISHTKFPSEELDIKPSRTTIRLSGLFYKTYEMERAGFPIDFTDAVDMSTDGKTYIVNGKDKTRDRKVAKARAYKVDYLRWKEVFVN